MPDLHPDQHCGLPGTTIYEALATVHDVVAYAEHTRTPMCIISIDFKSAFDNVAHAYLTATLRVHGFGEMIRRIRLLYDQASSKSSLNGFLTAIIPIHASIRQGCPLSMHLFYVVFKPPYHLSERCPEGNNDRQYHHENGDVLRG
jgi:hypothetical protein